MTTPAGTIAFSDVNVELGRSSTASLNLNEGSSTALGPRYLAGIFSGTISMNNLRNQSLLTVTGTTSDVQGIETVEAPALCTATTTDSASVGTVSGGTSPYTYSWGYVSGESATVNSPTSSSTTFTRSVFLDNPSQYVQLDGVYRCTVTDALGRIRISTNVGVQTIHQSL